MICTAARWPTAASFKAGGGGGGQKQAVTTALINNDDDSDAPTTDDENEKTAEQQLRDDKHRSLQKWKKLKDTLGEPVLQGLRAFKLHGNLPQTDRYVGIYHHVPHQHFF